MATAEEFNEKYERICELANIGIGRIDLPKAIEEKTLLWSVYNDRKLEEDRKEFYKEAVKNGLRNIHTSTVITIGIRRSYIINVPTHSAITGVPLEEIVKIEWTDLGRGFSGECNCIQWGGSKVYASDYIGGNRHEDQRAKNVDCKASSGWQH